MTATTEIAKLFATLGFNVETKNLDAFEKKLVEIEKRITHLRTMTSEAIKLNVVISPTALKTIGKNIRAAVKDASASSQLNIRDVNVSASAVKAAFRTSAKDLGIKISNVLVPKQLIDQALKNAAVSGSVKFSKVTITARALKDAMKDVSAGAELKINKVWIGKKPLQEALDAAAANLKLRIVQVQVNEHSLRQQLDNILARYRGMINPRATGSPGRATGGATSSHRMAFGGGMVGGALSNVGGLVGGAAAAYGIAGMNKMNQELQATELALGAVTGSSEEAEKKLVMLNAMGKEMGKTLRDIGPMYTQILAATKGTAMESETDNVFRGFMKYGTVMGLDSEAMKGSFRAISQMVSKQQVYAEELRGQMAERLPAAVRIAAEVMTGGDTKKLNKMMEAGQLDPNELLPKMAKYMEEMASQNQAYAKALNTSRVAQGRFNWQWEQTVKLFAESGFDTGMKTFFDTMSRGLIKNEEFVKRFGAAFEWAMNQIGKFGELFRVIGIAIAQFGESLGLSKEQMIIMSGVVAGLLLPFTKLFTVIALLAVALEDIYTYMEGGDSVFGEWFEGLDPQTQAQLMGIADAFGKLAASLKDLALNVFDKLGDFWGWLDDKGVINFTLDKIEKLIRRLTEVIELVNKLMTNPTDLHISDVVPDSKYLMGPAGLLYGGLKQMGEFFGGEAENPTASGLDMLKSAGMPYDGRRITGVPMVPGDPTSGTVSVNVKLSAEDITSMMQNGTFGSYMEEVNRKGIQDWLKSQSGVVVDGGE